MDRSGPLEIASRIDYGNIRADDKLSFFDPGSALTAMLVSEKDRTLEICLFARLNVSTARNAAARFGQPEVKLGLLPGGGGTQRLPRLVGKGRALQLILSGETIDAQEAYRLGLVNQIVPAADLIARAEAILLQIAGNVPIAVKLALEAVHKGVEAGQGEGCALEAAYFGLCAATEDKREGTAAFLAKRAPEFHGR